MIPFSSLVAFFLFFLALITWARKSWKWSDVLIVVVAFAVCITVWRWMYAREYRAKLYANLVPRSDATPDQYLISSTDAVRYYLQIPQHPDEGRRSYTTEQTEQAARAIRAADKQRRQAAYAQGDTVPEFSESESD